MEKNTDNSKKFQDINTRIYSSELSNREIEKIKVVLSRFNRIDLLEAVYTSVKELIINAAKANIKRVVFAENDLDIDHPDEWKKGTAIFRNKLNEESISNYSKKVKSLNFIDPQYLRIGTKGNETIARLEIPFSSSYVPFRKIKYVEKMEREKNSP